MSTASFDQVREGAVTGPLEALSSPSSMLGCFWDIQSPEGHVCCGGAGESKELAVKTAALLAHCYNHFPEVVERLRWYMEQEENYLYYGPIAQGETERVLKLVETVTLPD